MNVASAGSPQGTAVVATAVPWGLPADATFILPLIVVMMVFCWRALPGITFSPVVAVLLILLTDMMSGGPLGYWALLVLMGSSAGGYARSLGAGREVGPLWLVWAGLAIALAVFGWLLASAFFLRWVDWWPIAVGAAASMGLLALTDWLNSPISVAVMMIASVITVSDNGLAFTAIAEIAGPFWSGRALGTQNTSQLFTAGVAPPLFGALITAAGYPVAFAVCALFPLVALPLVPVDNDH